MTACFEGSIINIFIFRKMCILTCFIHLHVIVCFKCCVLYTSVIKFLQDQNACVKEKIYKNDKLCIIKIYFINAHLILLILEVSDEY